MNSDSFIRSIETQYSEADTYSINNLSTAPNYQPTWLISFDRCGQLIVGDPFEKIIVLLSNSGSELFRAGGEGRGPGEYQSILNLHVGKDKRLYVIDGLEFRVSIYRIRENQLEYIESIPFKNPPNYFLNSVYVTEYGKFGVFQVSEGFFTPKNQFLLYRLDDNFAPIEQLLEIPGNGRRKIESPHFTFYSPYRYLSQTKWYLDEEWFYYITTRESTINKFNVVTGEKEKITFLKLNERANSLSFTQSAKNYYPSEDKEYWATLEQIENLPLFNGLLINGNYIYLNLMPTPGMDGLLLVLNLDSEDITYIRTPQEFLPKVICENSIYGIDFRVEEDYQIMSIELDAN